MFWGRKVSNFFRELTQKNHKKVTFWQKTIPAKTMPTIKTTEQHPFFKQLNNLNILIASASLISDNNDNY